MGEELPKTIFNGRLKQINFAGLSEAGKELMDFVFPGFLGYRPQGDENIGARIANKRRFAPGMNFPRGRYYSVVADEPISQTERIDDGGTMVGELRAYRDPLAAGQILVFDAASNSAYSRSGLRMVDGTPTHISMLSYPDDIVVGLYDLQRLQKKFGDLDKYKFIDSTGDKWKTLRVARPGDDGMTFNLQYHISDKVFKRTVDLRYPQTRIAVCKKCLDFMKQYQSNAGNRQMFNWLDGLSTLLDPYIGGNVITALIGTLALTEGADAIIFPSARNDFVATYKDGVIEYFQGWNLIDISNYHPPQLDDLGQWDELCTHFTAGSVPETFDTVRNVTYDEPFGQMKPILLLTVNDGPYAGSIVTAGLERRVERGYWEAWLTGRSRWSTVSSGVITEREREDAKVALELLDEVMFPSIYKSRRIQAAAIGRWHTQIKDRFKGGKSE